VCKKQSKKEPLPPENKTKQKLNITKKNENTVLHLLFVLVGRERRRKKKKKKEKGYIHTCIHTYV